MLRRTQLMSQLMCDDVQASRWVMQLPRLFGPAGIRNRSFAFNNPRALPVAACDSNRYKVVLQGSTKIRNWRFMLTCLGWLCRQTSPNTSSGAELIESSWTCQPPVAEYLSANSASLDKTHSWATMKSLGLTVLRKIRGLSRCFKVRFLSQVHNCWARFDGRRMHFVRPFEGFVPIRAPGPPLSLSSSLPLCLSAESLSLCGGGGDRFSLVFFCMTRHSSAPPEAVLICIYLVLREPGHSLDAACAPCIFSISTQPML